VVEGRGCIGGGDGGEKREDADAQICGGPGNVTNASRTSIGPLHANADDSERLSNCFFGV
jgi:hypothetical protein